MAKKVTIIILAVIISLTFFLNAFSVDVIIDGRANERAWVDAPCTVLVSAKDISNCDIEYAAVTTIVDYDNCIVYFSFRAIVDGVIGADTLHGVSVDINNSGAVRIKRDSVSEYDAVYYSYTAALCEYNQTDFCVEAAVGIKHGIDNVYSIEVQFIDGSGNYSNVYSVSLPEPATEETTTYYQLETTDYYTESKHTESETTEKKTTEKKTTGKPVTTKITTTERLKSEKTTAVKTTKPATQKVTALPETTSAKPKDTTVKIVTVYVQVTDASSATSLSETHESSESAAEAAASTDDGSIRIDKELAYAGVAALLIITIGVCALVNMNYDKKSHNGSNN